MFLCTINAECFDKEIFPINRNREKHKIKTQTKEQAVNEKYANDGLELLAFNIAFEIAEQ